MASSMLGRTISNCTLSTPQPDNLTGIFKPGPALPLVMRCRAWSWVFGRDLDAGCRFSCSFRAIGSERQKRRAATATSFGLPGLLVSALRSNADRRENNMIRTNVTRTLTPAGFAPAGKPSYAKQRECRSRSRRSLQRFGLQWLACAVAAMGMVPAQAQTAAPQFNRQDHDPKHR